MRIQRIIILYLIVPIFIFLLGCNKKAVVIQMTASDLITKFKYDSKAATYEYKNSILEITGVISSIELPKDKILKRDAFRIIFGEKNEKDSLFYNNNYIIICSFDTLNSSEYKVGDKVVIRGFFNGFKEKYGLVKGIFIRACIFQQLE